MKKTIAIIIALSIVISICYSQTICDDATGSGEYIWETISLPYILHIPGAAVKSPYYLSGVKIYDVRLNTNLNTKCNVNTKDNYIYVNYLHTDSTSKALPWSVLNYFGQRVSVERTIVDVKINRKDFSKIKSIAGFYNSAITFALENPFINDVDYKYYFCTKEIDRDIEKELINLNTEFDEVLKVQSTKFLNKYPGIAKKATELAYKKNNDFDKYNAIFAYTNELQKEENIQGTSIDDLLANGIGNNQNKTCLRKYMLDLIGVKNLIAVDYYKQNNSLNYTLHNLIYFNNKWVCSTKGKEKLTPVAEQTIEEIKKYEFAIYKVKI